MRSKVLVGIVAVLVAVALTLPVMAKPVSKMINIAQPAKIGNVQLSAGDYRLLIDGDKVTVQKGKKVIAEVTGRWDQRPAKAEANSIVLGPSGEVQEIRFAGDRRVLVLTTP